jgi:hypothetical protein
MENLLAVGLQVFSFNEIRKRVTFLIFIMTYAQDSGWGTKFRLKSE